MKVDIKRGELGQDDSFTITFAGRDETLIVTNDGLLDQIRVTCDGKPIAVIPNKRCTHGVLRDGCTRCGTAKALA